MAFHQDESQTLEQGDVVVVEFDRALADLGQELIADGTLDGGDKVVARVLPSSTRADDDFSLGSLIAEFVVATSSGVSATLLAEAIKRRASRTEAPRRDVNVSQLPQGPGTAAPPHFRVTLDVTDSSEPPSSSSDE